MATTVQSGTYQATRIYIKDEDYAEWEAINRKYFQWQRLEFMADQMAAERVHRYHGGLPHGWKDCDEARLMRMKRRIMRALATMDCPDYVPPKVTQE
jgi:hypothetical protein